MAGDLKLTVDISALLQAQSIVKKMDGQVINLKFNTTGLESVNMMAKGLTTSSAKTKMLVSDIGQLGSAIKKVTTKDEFGNKAKEVTTYQQAIGQTRQEIEKFNKEGKATVTTIDSISDATSKYAANAKKQDATINKINKLSAQKYAGVIDQAGLSKQKSIVSALDPKSLDFDQRYSAATKAVTKYEVAASNALFTQKEMSKLYKGTGDQAVALFKEKQATIAALQKGTGDQAVDYFKAQEKAAKIELTNLGKKEAKIAEITTAEKKYGKVIDKNALAGIKSSFEGLDPKDINYEKKHTQLAQSLSKVTSSAKDAAYEQNQLTQANKKNLLSMDNIKESMGTAAVRTVEWAVSMGVLYGTFNAVKSMVSTSVAISDQMNSIKMVTGSSDSEIKSMLGTYQAMATELSSTTSQVAASAEVWVRQGRSISDTNDLIKTSTVLSKVGFMDSATSAQLLTSSINGYGIAAKDAMSVVDKMSAIDVNAATSTEDLAIAMAQTASGAKIAGVSMDELLSYIATISDVTQASGDTIGVSLKTIFARINSVKLGSLTDGEGEDISRVETVLKQYGITLRDTNGTARETGDILDELSTKWDSLTGLEKSEIAMQMAGVHQKEKFLVLMENYDKALKYQEISTNSAGSAMQKMSIWEQSTEAATQRLANQWEILSTNMVDSNFVKGIVSIGTFSLSALNTDVGQFAIKIAGLTTLLLGVSYGFEKIKSAYQTMATTGFAGSFIGTIRDVTMAQKEFAAVSAGAAASEMTFTKGSMAASVATQGLTKTLGASAIAFATNPITLIVAGITAFAVALKIANDSTTNFGERLQIISDLESKLSDGKSNVSSVTSELEKVNEKIKEIKASGADATPTGNLELSYISATREQLELKLKALKDINAETEKQISNESVTATKTLTQAIPGLTGTADGGGTLVNNSDVLKLQMNGLMRLQNQYAVYAEQRKNNQISETEYASKYAELDKNKEKLYTTASSNYASLADIMSKILPDSDENRAILAEFKETTAQWEQIGEITGNVTSTKNSASMSKEFNGATAEDFKNMASYISKIEGGVSTGLTETEEYKTSLSSLFSDVNPPTDIEASLESLKNLFSEDEEHAGKFLETVNQYKNSKGFDLTSLQNDFNLSDTAIATVNSRLQEMGLLMSTSASDGVMNLGNGLDLASDKSTEFELKLKSMLKPVKDGGMAFSDAESYIKDYLSSMDVSGAKIDQVVDNFSKLTEGSKQGNLLSFTGLVADGDFSVDGAFANVIPEIENSANTVASTFETTLKDQLNNGASWEQLDISSGFGTSIDTMKSNISEKLKGTGMFLDSEIQNITDTIANNTISANIDVVADAVVTQVDVPDADKEAVSQAIQASFNTTTMQFEVDKAKANVKALNLEGVDESTVEEQIGKSLGDVNVPLALTIQVQSTTDGTATVTQSFAEARAAATMLNGTSLDAVAGQAGGLASQVQSVEGAAQSTLNKLSELNGRSVTSTVTVNYVATGSAQAMADAGGGGSTASTDVFTGGNHGSATGRININTSQFGTESLIGEEGEETLIRNGKVSFIGTKGADIIPVRDGDTILPADITKRIKSGQIPMYAEGKYAVSITGSTTASTVANYKDSGNYNGLGDDAPEDEEAKKAYDAHKKAFDKEIAYAKHLRDMDEIDEAEYYRQLDSINERYFANRSDFLDEYRDHEAEVYEFLKKQEKERLENVKDSYDSSSDYILDILDKQIDKLKDEEDLKEKQDKVDNLRANKNQRVYYEGRGWVWEADQTKIAEAEKDVKDNSDSAKLQEYRDKWAEIADNYDNEQNKIEAISNLGDGFEKKVLSGDLGILRDFATKYSDVLGDVDSNDGDKTVPLIDYANAWKEEVTKALTDNSSSGILTTALSNSLMGGASTLSTLANQSSSNDTVINLNGDISLENVTDFSSFITEAKQYARVNSPK